VPRRERVEDQRRRFKKGKSAEEKKSGKPIRRENWVSWRSMAVQFCKVALDTRTNRTKAGGPYRWGVQGTKDGGNDRSLLLDYDQRPPGHRSGDPRESREDLRWGQRFRDIVG